MEKLRKSIEEEVATLVYYMNGGLSYVDAYNLSMEQMRTLSEVITKHYEKQNEAFTGGRAKKSR